MSKTVFRNSIYYMLSSIFPVIVGFLMLPIYSRFLTPEDYGVVALVLSLQSFLPLAMTLQIQSSIPRFYFEYQMKEDDLKIFISTIILFTLFLSVVAFGLISYFLDDLISFIFPKTIGYNHIFFIGVITAFFSVFNSIFINLIRVQQKAKLFMKISLCLFIFSLIVNIFEVVVFNRGAYGVLEASLITVFISMFVYFFMVKNFFVFKFDRKIIIEPLKYSIPLLPHSLSGLIFMYSDRIILERYVTLSIIGLYMFSDKVASAFKMLVNEFNNAFSPYFNQKSKESKELAIKETEHISLIFVYLTAMLIAFFSIFSVEIIYIFFDKKYFDTWTMIPLLSSAYIFRSLYCFSSSGLFYEKQTGKIASITILAGLVNIGLNLCLIPLYGVMVAIYTTIFSFFITYLMAEIMSYKIYYVKLNIKSNLLIVVYMFGVILFSIYINKSFFNFGYIEYVYKLLVLLLGLIIGYKLKLLNLKILKRLKK